MLLGTIIIMLSSYALLWMTLSISLFFYSNDPVSGLSSISWLLAQPDAFQRLHIPVPFPAPAGFGTPLQIGGGKNSRPSWVQAVPQVTELKETTTVRVLLCWADVKH